MQPLWRTVWRADSLENILMLGKIKGRRRRGWQEDEMIGWHHRLNGHKFELTPGDSEGQGSLVFFSPWCCKESDMTKRLNNNNGDTLKKQPPQIKTTIWPNNPTTGMYPQKAITEKDTCTPVFTAALFTIART